MSISNPSSSGSKNPIRVFVTFSGKTGQWKFFDAETKKESVLNCAIEGVLLDSNVSKISGYNKKTEESINSGYFKSVQDTIKVFAGKNLLISGKYADEAVKDKIKAKGGKWNAVLPIVTSKGNLMAVELHGAAMSNFFEFKKKNDLDRNPFIKLHKPYVVKNETIGVEYFTPLIELSDKNAFSPEVWNKAMAYDVEFQAYMNGGTVDTSRTTPVDEDPVETVYNREVAPKIGKTAPEQPVTPPVTEDDLPF